MTTHDVPQSYGDLKRLVAQSPRGDWPSRVNASMTHSQALDVLRAALDNYPSEMRIANSIRGDGATY